MPSREEPGPQHVPDTYNAIDPGSGGETTVIRLRCGAGLASTAGPQMPPVGSRWLRGILADGCLAGPPCTGKAPISCDDGTVDTESSGCGAGSHGLRASSADG